jgi:hypothetical protein
MQSSTRTTSPSSPLLLAALAYAKRGWPVFPLLPRDKVPLVKGGGGFLSATTDRNEILAWWATVPDANIGIATGKGFDVLDLDGEPGYNALREFLGERTYQHRGPVSLTGKGLHLLFRPTGSGNRAGLLEKIDFRGEGGYIVAPPSVHPLGHNYRWDSQRTDKLALPDAPDWLVELLHRDPPRKTSYGGIQRTNAPPGLAEVDLNGLGILRTARPDIIDVAEQLGLYMVHHPDYTLARCPFHPDNTPSMQMTQHDNRFFCHGCGANGDSNDLQNRRDMHGRNFI